MGYPGRQNRKDKIRAQMMRAGRRDIKILGLKYIGNI